MLSEVCVVHLGDLVDSGFLLGFEGQTLLLLAVGERAEQVLNLVLDLLFVDFLVLLSLLLGLVKLLLGASEHLLLASLLFLLLELQVVG